MLVAAGMAQAFVGDAAAISLTTEQRRQLSAGEIIVSVEPDQQGASARIKAAIEIAAPPDAVWAAMLDCKRSLKYVRGLVGCRVVSVDATGASDVREHLVSWIALLPQVRSVFRSEYVRPQSIKFQRVEGDIEVLEGAWQLEPMRAGTATRLHYNARVGKKTLVPGALIRAAIENDLPKTLGAMRQEVLRGAP